MTSYSSSIVTMSLSCTVSEILSLICQNLKRSRDPKHIPFGDNLHDSDSTQNDQPSHQIRSA